jgi:hypothetical protein
VTTFDLDDELRRFGPFAGWARRPRNVHANCGDDGRKSEGYGPEHHFLGYRGCRAGTADTDRARWIDSVPPRVITLARLSAAVAWARLRCVTAGYAVSACLHTGRTHHACRIGTR